MRKPIAQDREPSAKQGTSTSKARVSHEHARELGEVELREEVAAAVAVLFVELQVSRQIGPTAKLGGAHWQRGVPLLAAVLGCQSRATRAES